MVALGEGFFSAPLPPLRGTLPRGFARRRGTGAGSTVSHEAGVVGEGGAREEESVNVGVVEEAGVVGEGGAMEERDEAPARRAGRGAGRARRLSYGWQSVREAVHHEREPGLARSPAATLGMRCNQPPSIRCLWIRTAPRWCCGIV